MNPLFCICLETIIEHRSVTTNLICMRASSVDSNHDLGDRVTDFPGDFQRGDLAIHIKHLCRFMGVAIGVQLLLVRLVLPIFPSIDRATVTPLQQERHVGLSFL